MEIIFSQQAIQQMFKRDISVDQVKHAIMLGEEIYSYPEDKPYPSKLLLVFENEVPLHIVIAENLNDNHIIVITAYIPDQGIWKEGFKNKR